MIEAVTIDPPHARSESLRARAVKTKRTVARRCFELINGAEIAPGLHWLNDPLCNASVCRTARGDAIDEEFLLASSMECHQPAGWARHRSSPRPHRAKPFVTLFCPGCQEKERRIRFQRVTLSAGKPRHKSSRGFRALRFFCGGRRFRGRRRRRAAFSRCESISFVDREFPSATRASRATCVP